VPVIDYGIAKLGSRFSIFEVHENFGAQLST
jgi:hypothetical protein